MKITPKVVEPDFVEEKPRIAITIRAEYAQQIENDVIQVFIPTTELSKEENKMLEKLFPNTGNQIERLLKVEALMAAIVS